MRVKAGAIGFLAGVIVAAVVAERIFDEIIQRRLDLRLRTMRRSEAIKRGERDANEI